MMSMTYQEMAEALRAWGWDYEGDHGTLSSRPGQSHVELTMVHAESGRAVSVESTDRDRALAVFYDRIASERSVTEDAAETD